MAKRVRRKKRTQAQEEKRMRLLDNILNKVVCMKQNYGDEESYIFLIHRLTDQNSTSKIEQVLLSGDLLHDGVYLITDYDIDLVYDRKNKKDVVELRPKKFDLKAGKYAEEVILENYDELRKYLVDAKYLTDEEFFLYCQSAKKPPGIEEMFLNYDYYNQDKEV